MRCAIHFSDLSNRSIIDSDPRYTPFSQTPKVGGSCGKTSKLTTLK